MNRLQSIETPVEQGLHQWLEVFLSRAWTDPLVGNVRPSHDWQASLRFLLGCELAIRFGPDSCLTSLGGAADAPELEKGIKKVEAVLGPWAFCTDAPDFNAVLSLTYAWRQVLENASDPDAIARSAFRVPFHVSGIERIEGFVDACLSQIRHYGDWASSGFVKVHRWFDDACPNGPDRRMDPLTVMLSAPYLGKPCERSFISAVMASRPEMEMGTEVRSLGPFMLEAYNWARQFPEKFPEPYARLVDEIEGDQGGPRMAPLERVYRHWYGSVEPRDWDSHLLEALSKYVPTVVAGEKVVPPWSLQPSVFRAAVDFAAWAGIVSAHLCR